MMMIDRVGLDHSRTISLRSARFFIIVRNSVAEATNASGLLVEMITSLNPSYSSNDSMTFLSIFSEGPSLVEYGIRILSYFF